MLELRAELERPVRSAPRAPRKRWSDDAFDPATLSTGLSEQTAPLPATTSSNASSKEETTGRGSAAAEVLELRAELERVKGVQLMREAQVSEALARSAVQVAALLRTKEREVSSLREKLNAQVVVAEAPPPPPSPPPPRAALRRDRELELAAMERAAMARQERALAAERSHHARRLADVRRTARAPAGRFTAQLRRRQLALEQRCASDRAQLEAQHARQISRAAMRVEDQVARHDESLRSWFNANVADYERRFELREE